MTVSQETLSTAAARLASVRESVHRFVVGQDAVVDEALAAFLARGHVLLEGVPGTAKTLLVRALGAALGMRFGRIQFTPDLMPSDITGVSVLRDASRGFEFRPGPLFTDFLLADEINRAPAKTQSALLEAMAERQATVDGTVHGLGPLFSVFATQNPVEHEGTYPLPAAQLDRFLIKTVVPYPSQTEELAMLDRYAQGFDSERFAEMAPQAVLDANACAELRAVVDGVRVAPEIQAYIAAIVRATREDSALTLGASPRASVALFRVSRAQAVIAGRDFVTPDDVKDLALPVLRHRVAVAPELEVEGRTADQVLEGVLDRTEAPK
ncbi:MAG TPA: MoxR family ATPase [Gemmatimonadaceae bacterium]|nr:MoxR family ATPase [Gemmatimonadaceae bacterium]